MRPSTLTPAQQAEVVSDSEKALAVDEAKPAWSEVLDRWPQLQAGVKQEGTQISLDYLQDCKDGESRLRRLHEVEEMFSTFHRKDCELGREVQGRQRTVVMRDPDGRRREVPEHLEDRVGRRIGARRAYAQRGTRFMFDRQGRRWKRRRASAEWEPDW